MGEGVLGAAGTPLESLASVAERAGWPVCVLPQGRDFSNQDLQRSNFTSADCRDCNFKNSKLQGAYFIKTVVVRYMPAQRSTLPSPLPRTQLILARSQHA